MRVYDYGLFVALLFVVTSLNAQEDGPLSSSVSVELGKDSGDSKEAYLDLDLGFKNGLHLRGMLGRNRQESESEIFETQSRLAGISSDYAAPFVAGFDYEYWGNDTSLETHTRRYKFGANTDNWFLQLLYEDRQTRLYTNGSFTNRFGRVIDLPDTVDLDSEGKGLNISFYGGYPVSVSVSYIEYEYERDVTVLDKHPLLVWIIFPSTTTDMATGLEAWRRSGDIGYNFDWGTMGINGAQSESAVDKSIASTGSIYLIWEIARNWSTTFTGGESGTDSSDETVRFGRVAVTHRW